MSLVSRLLRNLNSDSGGFSIHSLDVGKPEATEVEPWITRYTYTVSIVPAANTKGGPVEVAKDPTSAKIVLDKRYCDPALAKRRGGKCDPSVGVCTLVGLEPAW